MLHKHEWKDESIQYTAPTARLTKVDGMSEDGVKALIFGVTNVTQRCTNCGKLDTYTVSGRVQ